MAAGITRPCSPGVIKVTMANMRVIRVIRVIMAIPWVVIMPPGGGV